MAEEPRASPFLEIVGLAVLQESRNPPSENIVKIAKTTKPVVLSILLIVGRAIPSSTVSTPSLCMCAQRPRKQLQTAHLCVAVDALFHDAIIVDWEAQLHQQGISSTSSRSHEVQRRHTFFVSKGIVQFFTELQLLALFNLPLIKNVSVARLKLPNKSRYNEAHADLTYDAGVALAFANYGDQAETLTASIHHLETYSKDYFEIFNNL